MLTPTPALPRKRGRERACGVARAQAVSDLQRSREGAAVEHDVLTGDVAGLGAAQERAEQAELFRFAETTARIELGTLGLQLFRRDAALLGLGLRDAAQAVGVERPGQEPVDGDVVDHGFPRQAGDESGQAGARAVGEAENVDRSLHRGRGDVDDAAELARHHAVDRRLDQLDRGQHVGVDGLDPVVAGPVAEIGGRPALLTRMSGSGQAFSTASRPAGVVMSPTTSVTVTPGLALRISSAVFASASPPRAVTVTCTPSLASAIAQAR